MHTPAMAPPERPCTKGDDTIIHRPTKRAYYNEKYIFSGMQDYDWKYKTLKWSKEHSQEGENQLPDLETLLPWREKTWGEWKCVNYVPNKSNEKILSQYNGCKTMLLQHEYGYFDTSFGSIIKKNTRKLPS